MSDSYLKKFVVKRGLNGLGLFATVPFSRGDCIIEYTGETISADEANRRGGQYLFELNSNFTIDGKDRSNLARYINHSCQPNCYPELTADETQVFIYAKRAIVPGEELTYNYGRVFFKQYIEPKGCRCSKCYNQSSS